MVFFAPADLRETTQKSWAANLLLDASDITDALLTSLIAQVGQQVEYDLWDDFDPPSPDNDETVEVSGQDSTRLYLPRRCRSVTTVKTRNDAGTLTTEAATAYRLHSSLVTGGTAIRDRRRTDYLEALSGLTTGTWLAGEQTVQVVGKFGWAAVPDDIKRLIALRIYRMVKSTGDPGSTVVQRVSGTGEIVTYAESSLEEQRIEAKYMRKAALTV